MAKNSYAQNVVLQLSILAFCAMIILGGCKSSKSTKPPSRHSGGHSKSEDSKGDYLKVLVKSKTFAEIRQCQARLRTLYKDLKMYTIPDGKFPDSFQELAKSGTDQKLFRCPARNGGDYIYVPSQASGRNPKNILVYETSEDKDVECNVLRLGGTVEALSAQQLETAIAETMQRLRNQ